MLEPSRRAALLGRLPVQHYILRDTIVITAFRFTSIVAEKGSGCRAKKIANL